MAFMVGARARKKRGSGRGRRDERGNPVRFDDRPEVTDDPAIAKSRGTEQHHRLDEHRGAERKHEHAADTEQRSEDHTSELQSLMLTSYAVFCLKKKIKSSH